MRYIELVAYLLALVSALFKFQVPDIAPYLLAVGAAILCGLRWSERYAGKNVRIKRILRIRHLIGIFWLAASYFMFKPGNYWMIIILIAVVLEYYSLWVIDHEKKKEEKQNGNK